MNQPEDQDKHIFKRGVKYTLSFVVIIWLVKLIEYQLELDFGVYGIFPRTLEGSLGIFLSPFIHGDFFHLLSNTFPILFLGMGLFYFYNRIAVSVIIVIYLITGFWVWLAARDAYHIGASGLVYGLLSFLLFSGFLRNDKSALAMSFIILVLYGGTLFYGVFPTTEGISWESHLMGALAGIFCAVYFRKTELSTMQTSVEEDSKTGMPFEYNYREDSNSTNVYTYTYNLKDGYLKDDTTDTLEKGSQN